MKHFTQIKSALLLCAMMIISVAASAAEVVYDFSTSLPKGWTATTAPLGYETSGSERGTQFNASSTLTLSGVSNVTKVVITCSANAADANTLAVSVGGTTWGTETLAKENNVEKTFTGSSASGNLVIDITRTQKSVYIKKIVITGEVEGSGNDDTTDDGLDPNYKYSEPTIIEPTGVTSNNSAYSFVQNNIKVDVLLGGQAVTYFGCNAGSKITFTATKEIKGILINGYVKMGFEATSDNGDIYYVDASEEAVENDPVVAILDIDSKSVTISCEKQMRCYSVEFYFDENPDIGTGGDDDYTYEFEPATPTNLNITFEEIEYQDYTDYLSFPYTDIYLTSDDFEMEIAVYAQGAEKTPVAPGVYPITSTYEEGTVQASPGGDDNYDYPTFIATDFEPYEQDGEITYYYNAAYYIVSGTLTVYEDGSLKLEGKTYYGSTVNAVYKPSADADAISDVKAEATKTTKTLRNGKLYLHRGNKEFNAAGVELK